MKAKCSKCKTKDEIFDQIIEGGETYQFCKICSFVLSKSDKSGNLKSGFLQEDFGEFPVSEIDKNIINARIDRASGKRKWSK
jgi:hypothetical protein